MLQRLDNFKGLSLEALDGELGRIDDFRFDDERWTVRYLVARTEPWLGRHVLISPISVGQPDWNEGRLEVRLSRDQIRNSPDVPVDNAFGREAEAEFAAYHGYPAYWGGPALWGWAGFPAALAGPPPSIYPPPTPTDIAGASVRSMHAFRGAHLRARDDEIGHVDDAIVDDESWRLRYLLADTSNWIGGTSVLVPTDYIREVDWSERRLFLELTTDQIRRAPRYDPARPLDRMVEEALERYYNLWPHGQPAPKRAAARRT